MTVRPRPMPGQQGRAHRMSGYEWGLVILLSVLFGSSFFFTAVGLSELPPITLVTIRMIFSSAFLWAVVIVMRIPVPTGIGTWAALILMGALNNAIPFGTISIAQETIESGLTAIINASSPLFTVLLAHLVTSDDKMTVNRILGILIGMAGIIVIMGVDALGGIDLRSAAQALCLIASVSLALAGVFGRRFRGMPIPMAAAGMATGAVLVSAPPAFIFEDPFAVMPSLTVWGAVITMGMIGNGVGYLVFFRILRSAGATNLMLTNILSPITAVLLGSLILAERLSWTAFIGMILVFIGLTIVDGRIFQLIRVRR